MPVEKSIELVHAKYVLKNGTDKDIHKADSNHLQNAYNVKIEVAIIRALIIIDCVYKQCKIKSIDNIYIEIVFSISKTISKIFYG